MKPVYFDNRNLPEEEDHDDRGKWDEREQSRDEIGCEENRVVDTQERL